MKSATKLFKKIDGSSLHPVVGANEKNLGVGKSEEKRKVLFDETRSIEKLLKVEKESNCKPKSSIEIEKTAAGVNNGPVVVSRPNSIVTSGPTAT